MPKRVAAERDRLRRQIRKLARDYVVASGTIACRLRRPDYWRFRGVDITVRAALPKSGNTTKLEKFIRGDVQWMLYGWTSDDHMAAWVFLDVAKMIGAQLHERRELISNFDGWSGFITIPVVDIA